MFAFSLLLAVLELLPFLTVCSRNALVPDGLVKPAGIDNSLHSVKLAALEQLVGLSILVELEELVILVEHEELAPIFVDFVDLTTWLDFVDLSTLGEFVELVT